MRDMLDGLSYVLVCLSVAFMAYGMWLWVQHPELTQMQLLLNYLHVWGPGIAMALVGAAIVVCGEKERLR